MRGLLIRLLRDLRLVPLVICATIALFALKALGLVLDGGYLFDNVATDRDEVEITGSVAAPGSARTAAEQPPETSKDSAKPSPQPSPKQPPRQSPRQSWAQEMFNYPGASAPAATAPEPARPSVPSRQMALPSLDITGAVGQAPSPAKEEMPEGGSAAKMAPQEPPPQMNGTPVPLDIDRPVSPAERAILESLQKRRAELDARAHDLDVREDLLRAAEKRVGGRIEELKELEGRISAALQQRDGADAARFKNVVSRPHGAHRRRAKHQPAQHVRDPGADDPREGAAPDRRACGAAGAEGPAFRDGSAQDPGPAGCQLTARVASCRRIAWKIKTLRTGAKRRAATPRLPPGPAGALPNV